MVVVRMRDRDGAFYTMPGGGQAAGGKLFAGEKTPVYPGNENMGDAEITD